jgi:hypothetical protein
VALITHPLIAPRLGIGRATFLQSLLGMLQGSFTFYAYGGFQQNFLRGLECTRGTSIHGFIVDECG